ncbi:hypothetical protein Vadar_016469 [Vaccinium darrowii]|uniref:Uncharacterized protein n=1 Tax=Vaccinium darrowii TaxID=229202 RepID=A0ACB7YDW6_9ERIC|nr:hypothetical protein Vadar_016469 [Vaccinium darrowii]
MNTVAVAVQGGGGTLGDDASRRAVRWAVDKLMPNANLLVLLHVVRPITSIPTPSGDAIPIDQLDDTVVEMYMKDTELARKEIFVPFKKLCRRKNVEIKVLEGENPASALHKYVTESGVSSLVLGSRRRLKDSTVPSAFQEKPPKDCKVYVVRTKRGLLPLLASATPLSSSTNSWCSEKSSLKIYKLDVGGSYSLLHDWEIDDTASSVSDPSHSNSVASGQPRYPNRFVSLPERNRGNSGNRIHEIEELNDCSSVASAETKQSDVQAEVEQEVDCQVNETASSVSDLGDWNSIEIAPQRYPYHSGSLQERNHENSRNGILEDEAENECPSVASAETKESVVQEVEQLRLELRNAVGMYNRAFEDLVHRQNEVHFLSSECLEETRQVNAALQREEVYKKQAAKEKRKHLEAVKEIEKARNLLAKEISERQIAVFKAIKESMEKQKIMNALLSNDRRYKRYTREEIETATESFSETKVIGGGSYGKVYRCDLDKTPVAVKVLHAGASEMKKEFLREIEVLCQLRHPNIVLLLGACPEIGCLVFEYVENGSLEDFISKKSSRHPLPWFVRFRIAFEVACGLAFLHNTKPNPIIHRDLKPGNIFLDRNYVSKIGDVGLAKLVSNVTPDSITEYRDSTIFGSLHYVDPEYHRTGTVRPKSDLYAFGIIILQLLTAQHPNGILLKFETALSNGRLPDILDKSISGWPLAEVEELAQMGLKCSRLRCRDRPDLATEVLPTLKKLVDMANNTIRIQRNSIHPPNHYFCPILQDVMEDPYIAADGFTYEHRAIKAWLERHSASPVTKLKLQHKELIQNHTLRSAIQDWRSRIASTSG